MLKLNDLSNQHLPQNILPLDMKGCICHFVKWHIHPFIFKGPICHRVQYHLLAVLAL